MQRYFEKDREGKAIQFYFSNLQKKVFSLFCLAYYKSQEKLKFSDNYREKFLLKSFFRVIKCEIKSKHNFISKLTPKLLYLISIIFPQYFKQTSNVDNVLSGSTNNFTQMFSPRQTIQNNKIEQIYSPAPDVINIH